MLYPSIDALMDKIDSKYSLVTLSSKRAREIQRSNNGIVEKPVSHKYVGKALEEIYAGYLTSKKTDSE
ncbi:MULTISPECIES: DNA-directed RNA polymerase subunit omega [Fictibacillus]|uniref:DNA-directed RNA polymerase subunit omega n=3 Tax=Fictibacillus TaxID=1329200 RepID=A0A0V8JDK6_9BACL|nr:MULTISPECIES: DNA-directed RNA polymerase subunit omega [Fictibacillus]KSU85018.1 DNA-directed RNA polymerase subunit omega [Fictibacillus enclensis]MDM5198814.1 DNA-directed RNA polymerase subunit omega [Fictibacillus enclensis]MDN4523477.1 DNA-directed RNA polymerase subunit omega [Fictibacillus sp. NE201]RXY99323.1 DNA-directed RNA polymerase subunit omega [Fictibacillus sp. S7]SCB89604.1 DNA-directed RNA polymerase subunit omega [Fictibacillus enclensis]